jgi:hypothetical protein
MLPLLLEKPLVSFSSSKILIQKEDLLEVSLYFTLFTNVRRATKMRICILIFLVVTQILPCKFTVYREFFKWIPSLVKKHVASFTVKNSMKKMSKSVRKEYQRWRKLIFATKAIHQTRGYL